MTFGRLIFWTVYFQRAYYGNFTVFSEWFVFQTDSITLSIFSTDYWSFFFPKAVGTIQCGHLGKYENNILKRALNCQACVK